MLLSYVENKIYYLGMFLRFDGDYEIRLYKKIDENHGGIIYKRTCREISKKEDFAKYHEIEKLIENNENEQIKKEYEIFKARR